jgi:hypothetical protein
VITFWRSVDGYGWSLTFGKRVRWNSRKATSRMWPHLYRGTDEHCNRAVSLILWPLGHLDVWWEPRWRTSPCEKCQAEFLARKCCTACGNGPCDCVERGYVDRLWAEDWDTPEDRLYDSPREDQG